jgi:hypothetical protein
MGSMEKRLEKIETAWSSSYELWDLFVSIGKGRERVYAVNRETGEEDEGYYLSQVLKDKRETEIQVVISKRPEQSIEEGGGAE